MRIIALYCLPNDAEAINSQLQALLSQPPSGIILLGFGAGNVPYSAALAETLELAHQKGHMVYVLVNARLAELAIVMRLVVGNTSIM